MSLWGRLFGRRPKELPEAPEPKPAPPTQQIAPKDPVVLGSQEELWLSRLATELAEGRRGDDIASDEFWLHIDSLWAGGHERLAIQWLEKFTATNHPDTARRTQLRVKLVEFYDERRQLESAVEHLEELTLSSEHCLKAHFTLAEHFEKRGQESRALKHYEAVLAKDVDYPNVRSRVERLRRARGRAPRPAIGDTMTGDIGGVAAGSRYTLKQQLGRGATGTCFLARDRELDRDVAIKLLHPHLGAARQASACARFFAEARIAASLRHPNILAILDLDEPARRIVMELAGGGTLRSALAEHGPRSPRRALERHTQLLSALCAAHSRGIVHRDVKPANLMFRRPPETPGTEIVLGDFGVAHLPEADSDVADAGAVGTLAYMPPEQRRAQPASGQWDVYAAGVVLFEMLTGKLPWSREQILSGERADDDLLLLDHQRPDISGRLREAVQDHLRQLGATDGDARLSSDVALATARTLSDLAVLAEAAA